MKTYHYILAATLAFAACADNDEFAVNGLSGSGEPIELYGEIEQGYQTRVNDSGFADGDVIGVYIVDRDKDGAATPLQATGNHATNVKYTFNEANYSWQGAAQLYWTDKNTCVDAYSYYPFTDYIADVSAYPFTVARHQDKDGGYELSDFLWAKAENVQPGHVIDLQHRHVMSCVQVRLIEGEDFDSTWDALEKTVTVTGTTTDAAIDLQTGEVSVAEGSAECAINPYKKGDEWRCIVAPQTVEEGKTIVSVVVDGDSYNFARTTATTFLPGRMYKFTFKVNKILNGDYQFSLVDEAITAWEADAVSHQAEAKVYTVIHVPEAGSFKAAIESSGINIKSIKNLKLTGTMNQTDFDYFSENFSHILALNMKELRTKDIRIVGGQWWERAPGYGIFDDNHEVTPEDKFDDAIPSFLCRGDNSFKLRSIVLPDKLKYIGAYAFNKTPITGILEIPEGVVWMGDCMVGGYGSETYHITKLIIPSTVVYIGASAIGGPQTTGGTFTNELNLPDGLKYIGEAAFMNCTNTFGQARLPSSLEFLGDGAFLNVALTGTVVFPAGMKVISNAFGGGSGWSQSKHITISGVYIPEGTEEINYNAFGGRGYGGQFETFKSDVRGDIVLPKSLKRLGFGAFAGSQISHISIPANIGVLERDVFYDCKCLIDTLIVPEGIRKVSSGCFYGCSNLDAIILPSTLEIIGGDDSEYNYFQSSVFGGCNSLSYLRCDAKIPPTLIGDVFGGDDWGGIAKDNFTLVVPEESIELYQQAEGWREFKRIAAYKNFVCRPQIAKVLNKGGKRDVVLNCDAAQTWSVTHCPDWLHIDKTSGKGKSTFTITIDAMEHGHANRSDEIVLKMGDTEYTTSFKVSQFDYEYDEDQDYTIQQHTKGSGIPLVFIGDGYDAEDIADGTYLEYMMHNTEYFFDVEPYKTYRDYFDVYTGFAMSYESGIGSVNYLRNTKFETFLGDGVSRMACNFDAALFYAIDNTTVKEDDMGRLTCVVIPNTTAYDGVTMMYPNGAAVALCPQSTLSYPYDARGLVQHEAGGHGFGKQADEYIYHLSWIQSCGCSCCEHVDGLQTMQAKQWGLNLSLSGKAKDLPWQHLLKDWRTSDIVDVWEGGFFHYRGVFRSEYNSCMNNNVPYYSTWSRELIVRRIKQLAGETYDYEDFMVNDSREWGHDFTLGTRALPYSGAAAPVHGQAPIIKNVLPKRSNIKK